MKIGNVECCRLSAVAPELKREVEIILKNCGNILQGDSLKNGLLSLDATQNGQHLGFSPKTLDKLVEAAKKHGGIEIIRINGYQLEVN